MVYDVYVESSVRNAEISMSTFVAHCVLETSDDSSLSAPVTDFTLKPELVVLDSNTTLGVAYCLNNACRLGHGTNFSYNVPLSPHFPISQMTLYWHLADNLAVTKCHHMYEKECSEHTEVQPAPHDTHSWTLPVGYYGRSFFLLRVGDAQLVSHCVTVASEIASRHCKRHSGTSLFTLTIIKSVNQCLNHISSWMSCAAFRRISAILRTRTLISLSPIISSPLLAFGIYRAQLMKRESFIQSLIHQPPLSCTTAYFVAAQLQTTDCQKLTVVCSCFQCLPGRLRLKFAGLLCDHNGLTLTDTCCQLSVSVSWMSEPSVSTSVNAIIEVMARRRG